MDKQDAAVERDIALARAIVYDFLAQTFAYPTDERFKDLQELASLVMTNGGWLPVVRLAALVRESTLERVRDDYLLTMSLNSSPDCPLYETAYFGTDPIQQTQRMADVAGFYRAFGVDSSGSDARPDDLWVELEFMSYLCRKEAYALEHSGPPRVAQMRKAQRMFLENHLGSWAAVVGRKVTGLASPGMFHAAAGVTLESWMALELENLGAKPVEVSGHVAQWLAPASHGPEFAGGASFVPMEELAVR